MEKLQLNSYMDAELTRKLEGFVINALPDQAYRSDFNMLYIANIEIQEDEDGKKYQVAVETADTFLMSITNDFGYIDYRPIKTVHAAGVFESDFETMEFTPRDEDLDHYATYHKLNPIPEGGGYINVAISPFGVTIVEMLNGEEITLFGNGRFKVTAAMKGFKRYKQIPKVSKILSNDNLKILKIALYTRYDEFMHRQYSLNIFSPTMKIVKDYVEGQYTLDDERIKLYIRDGFQLKDGKIKGLINRVNNETIPAEAEIGFDSNIYDIDKTIRINRFGYIDASVIGEQLKGDFSIHFIATINDLNPQKGSILLDCGYGLNDTGYQTHHLTLWINPDGNLCYNGKYADEWIDTGYQVKLGLENIFTVTVENQKFEKDAEDEYVIFIHVNGKQIWPKEEMLTKTEKIYVWRAMEAYRTYNEVCAQLPAPHPINGGLDARTICAKKLLHESGFITLDNLYSVYQLYLKRPQPSKADPTGFIFGDNDKTTIKRVMFGQDSEKDQYDPLYYLDGSFSEIVVFQPSLGKKEIEALHMLNILRCATVEIDE